MITIEMDNGAICAESARMLCACLEVVSGEAVPGDTEWIMSDDMASASADLPLPEGTLMNATVTLGDGLCVSGVSYTVRDRDSSTLTEYPNTAMTPLQELEASELACSDDDSSELQDDLDDYIVELLGYLSDDEPKGINGLPLDGVPPGVSPEQDKQHQACHVPPGLHGYVEGVVPVPDLFLTFRQANAYLHDLARTFEVTIRELMRSCGKASDVSVDIYNLNHPSIRMWGSAVMVKMQDGGEKWFQELPHPEQMEVFESAIRVLYFLE